MYCKWQLPLICSFPITRRKVYLSTLLQTKGQPNTTNWFYVKQPIRFDSNGITLGFVNQGQTPSTMKRVNVNEEEDFYEGDKHAAKRLRTEDTEHLVTERQHEVVTYPFFFYKDFSTNPDPDSLVPLTAPGRVPNFPAKMHAILSRQDLADVICWMPHGRGWKVHKPREFEVSVLPTYFEHSKFSSFIRQANGWGFRRINAGRDRNCYYHPQFLRGLPHLCKEMKRPGVSQKAPVDPDREPDLYRISEIFPVPERAQDDSIMLFSTLNGGPKARISISSILPHHSNFLSASAVVTTAGAALRPSIELTPRDQEALSAFYMSLGQMSGDLKELSQGVSRIMSPESPVIQKVLPSFAPGMQHQLHNTIAASSSMIHQNSSYQTLVAANQLAFAHQPGLYERGNEGQRP
jgi:HSF-type DNA-binding